MYNPLLALFFLSFTLAAEYTPLKDQVWSECHSSEYVAEYRGESIPVKYRFCSIGSNISAEQIDDNITVNTQLVFDFAGSLGIEGGRCILNENIEIYDIKVETLNEPGRFPKWINPSPYGIWALYDPRVNERSVSSLILTDHGPYWNDINFAHELSHYWYDTMCWNKYRPGVEKFAVDFEVFYLKNRSK